MLDCTCFHGRLSPTHGTARPMNSSKIIISPSLHIPTTCIVKPSCLITTHAAHPFDSCERLHSRRNFVVNGRLRDRACKRLTSDMPVQGRQQSLPSHIRSHPAEQDPSSLSASTQMLADSSSPTPHLAPPSPALNSASSDVNPSSAKDIVSVASTFATQLHTSENGSANRPAPTTFVHVGTAQPRHYYAAADLHINVFYPPKSLGPGKATAATLSSFLPSFTRDKNQAAAGSAAAKGGIGMQPAAATPAATATADGSAALTPHIKSSSNTFGALMARLDRVLALQLNETLEEQGNGRSVLLIAVEFPAEQHQEILDAGLTSTQPITIASRSGSMDEGSSSCSSSVPSVIAVGLTSEHNHDDLSSNDNRMPLFVSWLMRCLTRKDIHPGLGCSADEVRILGAANLDSFGDLVPKRTRRGPMDTGNVWMKRPGYAYISNVAVSPTARRKGVATALMAAATDVARDWGCGTTALHVDPKNASALGLYSSIGYKKTTAQEPVWIPYISGRAPDRCYLYIKRVPQSKPQE